MTGVAGAAPPPPSRSTASTAASDLPDYDARGAVTSAQRAAAEQRSATAAAAPGLSALRATLGDQLVADVDPLTGTPRQLARLDGLLTGPSGAAASEVALGYVRSRPEVFGLSAADLAGLRLRRDYLDVEGTHHLSWVQTAGGVELFGNGLQANVTKDGSLLSVLGAPVPGLTAPAATRRLAAADALTTARAEAGGTVGSTVGSTGVDTVTPVLFQTTGGTRPAWRTITMSARNPALRVVDAEDGRLLYRRSLRDDANAPAGHATATAYQYFRPPRAVGSRSSSTSPPAAGCPAPRRSSRATTPTPGPTPTTTTRRPPTRRSRPRAGGPGTTTSRRSTCRA